MPYTRSRRLRKKLHVDEFQTLGFKVEFNLAEDLSAEQSLAFWDAFIAEAVEANQLTYGGAESGFIVPERGSATEKHCESVRSWLTTRREVLSVAVGPLVDANAWYPDVP